MTSLDPFLYHLHRQGSGSWAQFSRSVGAFDILLDAYSCARGIAEHAMVEFDFDHDRSWSVTSVQLVEADRLGMVGWGGTHRALTECDDIDVEIGHRSAWIDGREFGYKHGIRIRKRGPKWPSTLAPINAQKILGVIPALATVVGSRPLKERPLRKAERLDVTLVERRNPGSFRAYELRGAWAPSEGVSAHHNAVWKLDRATYVVSRNHLFFWAYRDVALWTGFLNAADRLGTEHLAYYDEEPRTLHLAAYPRLPIAYVRMLLLCGAREAASGRRDKRIFTNVDSRTALWLRNMLGITLLR